MKRIYVWAALSLLVWTAFAQQTPESLPGEPLCLRAEQPKAGSRQLFILHTSDTHSRIEPISPEAADRYAGMGGAVRRVSLVKEAQALHPDLLLLDCGDISQGTPYYNFFRGEVEVEMMNLMKYDAMTIGNHEFDFGLENMARLFRRAKFPVVCANYDVRGTVLEGLVKPYIVLERSGVRIGIFGLGTKLEGMVQADKCEGVTYLDPIATAQQTADRLRRQEGCDVVICLSHLGIRGIDANDDCDERLVAATRGIDLILGGHSHTFMEKPENYLNADGVDVPLLHTGKSGIFVGEVVMELKKQ